MFEIHAAKENNSKLINDDQGESFKASIVQSRFDVWPLDWLALWV